MPTSRKLSKERTRARLLQATLKVLHADGAAALTTGRIAEAAGVAQPTFYVHFSGIEEALQSSATTVSDRWLVSLHAVRQGIDRSAPASTIVRDLFSGYLEVLLEDPKNAELFLRHRRDSTSPLGRTFAKLADIMRRDLAEDLAIPGVAFGTPGPGGADVDLGVFLGLLESILDERATREEALRQATDLLVKPHEDRGASAA